MNLSRAESLVKALQTEARPTPATVGIIRWMPGLDGWAVTVALPYAPHGVTITGETEGGEFRWHENAGISSEESRWCVGMAPLVRSIREALLGEHRETVESEMPRLRQHLVRHHRNLLGSGPDSRIGHSPLPDVVRAMHRLPVRFLLAVHTASHNGLFVPHRDDDWLLRAEMVGPSSADELEVEARHEMDEQGRREMAQEATALADPPPYAGDEEIMGAGAPGDWPF